MSGQNTIDQNGGTIQTFAQILDELLNGAIGFPGFKTIFPNAVTDPNSPDGNLLNLVALSKLDELQFILQALSSMDPDQAIGAVLDQRCAYNGVTRQAGTYTQVMISVTVTQALTLPGIDTFPNSPFTASDAQGNQYQLLQTHAFGGAGTVSLAFEAALLGPTQSAVNTVTTIVTPQLGVTAVNNPSSPTSVGTNQESDSALRIRRAASVALPSIGYLGGMLGAIQTIPGVVQAICLENPTAATNAFGMPPYSTWFIVQCPSSDYVAVAQAIYLKRIAGIPQTNSGRLGAGTASVAAGGVTGIAVAAGGSGYANPPVVQLTGGGGTGATATATITNGVVVGITITSGGTGYTTPPAVAFTGGGGSGAAGTAVLSGTSVASVTITAGGSLYTSQPAVGFSGGGGSGAAGTANLANGVITAFTVTAAGSGYGTPPTVTLNPNTIAEPITQVDATTFYVYFDIPVAQQLYFRAQIDAIDSVNSPIPSLAVIGATLVAALTYKIGQKADASSIVELIKQQYPGAYVTNAAVSTDNSTWLSIVAPTGINYQFTLPFGNLTLTA